MKTDVITITNLGKGCDEAVAQVEKVAVYNNLNPKEKIQLQLLTEEMMALARSITGEMTANFWIENDKHHYELHLKTHTLMDAEKRGLLILSSSNRKNEAANTFLGKIRNMIEEHILPEADFNKEFEFSSTMLSDLPMNGLVENEWDGLERSVLLKTSDEVKVSIKGGNVEIIVIKNY